MLVVGFPVGQLQANCYVLAPHEGGDCVVVDPGQDAVEPVRKQLDEHGLTPVGVLLTHGHFDHVFSAGELCESYGIPAWLHPEDRYMLADPGAALGPEGSQLFEGVSVNVPEDVRELSGDTVLNLAGMEFDVRPAPGHTGGSVLFGTGTAEGGRLLLTGDTLFTGAIGRTDLPGGDHERMLRTLRNEILSRPDDTAVLPGHGSTTTIGRERESNPFLRGIAASDEAAD
ncbi:Glyoxylase, beta-lactamase superfamily II [Actinopolyspora lacussalsi subsp. righensis]|uniref:Glyoxylase, beta-lactamase superfamily II n=1 Tax=Actinopolyspora righensis TaxID=995060 RepID=A0A1I7CAY1_9ACTN|nr:MBL fold metallo-hydrolase [Actinopolyspora righensis]SFT96586.1 Glyoxylase, beta-lactamase superfamily II [Actinopolyspora righensis]